jgi:hypothetical protein
MNAVKSLGELVEELPPEIEDEVRNFIESLLAKQERTDGRRLRQNWAGALRQYRQQYNSIDLQHQALNWRGD